MHLAYQSKAMSYGGRRNKAQLKVIYPVFITEQQTNCTKSEMKSSPFSCDLTFLTNFPLEKLLFEVEHRNTRVRTPSPLTKISSIWQKDRVSQTATCPLASAQGLSP
jgi:hypothetical protein